MAVSELADKRIKIFVNLMICEHFLFMQNIIDRKFGTTILALLLRLSCRLLKLCAHIISIVKSGF